MLGVRFFSAKLINIESAELTKGSRAGLRISITKTTRPAEEMVREASHDVAGDSRYAAFHRSRVGDRSFLWLYPAISAENTVVDRGSLDLPL
jgi:hypothetical protein